MNQKTDETAKDFFAAPWKTIFSSPVEQELSKNNLLTTIARLGKEWRVSVEVNPRSYEWRSYASVLHLTTGGSGSGPCARVGDSTPALWLHPTRGVLVSTALNGKASFSRNVRHAPPAGQWSQIEVSQIFDGEKYTFSILVNGTTVFSTTNNKPETFSNINIYASNPWAHPLSGKIRGLTVEHKYEGKFHLTCYFLNSSEDKTSNNVKCIGNCLILLVCSFW